MVHIVEWLTHEQAYFCKQENLTKQINNTSTGFMEVICLTFWMHEWMDEINNSPDAGNI